MQRHQEPADVEPAVPGGARRVAIGHEARDGGEGVEEARRSKPIAVGSTVNVMGPSGAREEVLTRVGKSLIHTSHGSRRLSYHLDTGYENVGRGNRKVDDDDMHRVRRDLLSAKGARS